MIQYNSKDTRRINHALKVFSLAKCIIENGTTDKVLVEIVCLSAILHDIGIHVCEEKYNSSAGKYQEIEGPHVANEILLKHYENNDIIKRVLYLIAHHHTYNKIDGLDYQVLIEADLIVNFEEKESSKKTILATCNKLFKTATGINILKSMLM
ncbi:MAG: HD domain-containing protein [Clostridiales bacterium]|nr:HD domain-containing protein [Clostridiales bacterium]